MVCELKITYDPYEDAHDIKCIMNAQKMQSSIFRILQMFREELKYNEELTEEEYKVLDKMRDRIMEELTEEDLLFTLD